jgi:uncharacterized protein YhfF
MSFHCVNRRRNYDNGASVQSGEAKGGPAVIGTKSTEVEKVWRELRAAKGIEAVEFHACTFSDPAHSPNADKIGNLAVSGHKRATAHLAQDFERNGVARREPGDYWLVLNAAQAPICLVRVTGVEVKPFDQVGEETAIAEGEGDLSLEYWATVHRRYFEKQCALWGIEWREDLPTVCEYFDLVWPDPQAT